MLPCLQPTKNKLKKLHKILMVNFGKNGNSSPNLTNCVFDKNVAELGGGVFSDGCHFVDGDGLGAGGVGVGEADISDAIAIFGDFLCDLLIASHFEGAGGVVTAIHGELLAVLVGAGRGVPCVDGDFSRGSADFGHGALHCL